MKQLLLPVFSCLISVLVHGATVSGTVKERSGAILPFSSILIKGTTKGVSANAKGVYEIQLPAGDYTLLCQSIGHSASEKAIHVTKADLVVDFVLEEQQYSLKDVEVKSGGEDPAYAIIRKAIATREQHLKELNSFKCEVYIKGQMQLRSFPKSFFGRKIDFEDGDTSKRKMIFLSETVANYSVEDEKQKVEVISTRVSGRSGGFGLSDPQIVSFYRNSISVGEDLNPRGFISPIADGALSYYKYHFEGMYYENGRAINRIRVIPRRKYEPLFSGHINIIEDEWRIQSVDLLMVKEQQMQLLDTLRIQQLYVPSGNVWVIKNQVIYPSGKFLGFDFFGNFVQVYDKFDMSPVFAKRFFDHIVLKFYDSSNRKARGYWDSIRPVPLLKEEINDYRKKDSLEQVRKDPHYLDSLDAKRNKLRLASLLLNGQSFSHRASKEYVTVSPVIGSINYNTVEGAVIHTGITYTKRYEGRRQLLINPTVRYGITNTHVNPGMLLRYSFGKKYPQNISLSGGQNVFQFYNGGEISERDNTLSTLLYKSNHLKIYEAAYLRAGYSAGIGNGLNINLNFQYQDRRPLENLADPVSWKNSDKAFTPNYPVELMPANMQHNRASMLTAGITWNPGADYIEFPDRKVNIGSKYPTLAASVTKGIRGLFGSDVDYTKWRVGVSDELDLKLAGALNYNVTASGFFDAAAAFVPDYIHFVGNQTIFASAQMNSFQLAPYYQYANTSAFNLEAHLEYHLNGLLSNKIPGFKRLNWFFVTGANALHTGDGRNYYEWKAGIENILKIFRIDFVQGYEERSGNRPSGFRITMPL